MSLSIPRRRHLIARCGEIGCAVAVVVAAAAVAAEVDLVGDGIDEGGEERAGRPAQ